MEETETDVEPVEAEKPVEEESLEEAAMQLEKALGISVAQIQAKCEL